MQRSPDFSVHWETLIVGVYAEAATKSVQTMHHAKRGFFA